MDDSITTSIADLYKAGANPMRTNPERVQNIKETLFVQSRHGSRHGRSREGSRRSREGSRRMSDESDQESIRSRSSYAASDNPPSLRYTTPQPPSNQNDTYETMKSQFRANLNSSILNEKENEKRMYLQELERMRQGGGPMPSKPMTHNDNFADIEFEYNRVKQTEDQISTVSFIKDFIRLACTGIELGNSKLGLLRLNGWASECTADMGRFDRPLNRVYAKYWRRGGVSPLVELTFLVFGSLLVHHFKNVMFPSASTAPQRSSPPTRNVPFNIPTGGAPPPSSEAPKRPTMKRPTMRRPPTNGLGAMANPMGAMGSAMGGLSAMFGKKSSGGNPSENRFSSDNTMSTNNLSSMAPPQNAAAVMFVNVPMSSNKRASKGPDVEIIQEEANDDHIIDMPQDIETGSQQSLDLDDL